LPFELSLSLYLSPFIAKATLANIESLVTSPALNCTNTNINSKVKGNWLGRIGFSPHKKMNDENKRSKDDDRND
jgi:hypothetical protein